MNVGAIIDYDDTDLVFEVDVLLNLDAIKQGLDYLFCLFILRNEYL